MKLRCYECNLIKKRGFDTKKDALEYERNVRPYFEGKSVSEISAMDILQWQNEMLSRRDENGKGYSPTYLRTINNQLTAILNHAVRYYGLHENEEILILKKVL